MNANNNSDYIQIVLKYYKNNGSTLTTENNFESKTEKDYNKFLKDKSTITYTTDTETIVDTIKYTCTNITKSTNSDKVIKVEIQEIKN